jgi:hypothetical protein
MTLLIREDNIGNLALELLKDCDYSCSGCSVNTQDVTPYTEDDLYALTQVVEEVRQRGWEMSWMEFAPTDVMAASNRRDVFTHPAIKDMVKGFKSVVFNCSFLNPNPDAYVQFAKELEAFMPGLDVEFLVPFELKHHRNLGYIEKLRGRIAWFEQHLTSIRLASVTTIVNLTETMLDSGLITEEVLYETRHIQLFKRSDTTTFVLHNGRRDLTVKSNREEFVRTILKQNAVFANQLDKGYEFKIDDLDSHVGSDYHLSYRDGELYIAPLINSPIAVFHPDFKFDKPWTLDSIQRSDQQTYFKSVEHATTLTSCSGCHFVSKCATRGVHRLQRLLETDQCLSILGHLPHKCDW